MARIHYAVLFAALLLPVRGSAADNTKLLERADRLVAGQQFAAARTLYERALASGAKLYQDLPRARNLAAVYLNSVPPDDSHAIEWLGVVLRLDPADDAARRQLAEALRRDGDAAGAVPLYRALADAHTRDGDYVLPLAEALSAAGQGEAARDWLRTSANRFPHSVPIRLEYARQLNFAKQFSDAREQFSAVLAMDPGNLKAQLGLAKTASYDGDQESAIFAYDRILQRQPGWYDALVGKAFALLWSGRTQQAHQLLQQAARRHPEDHEVIEALSTLEPTTVSIDRPREDNRAARRQAGKLAPPSVPKRAALATAPRVQSRPAIAEITPQANIPQPTPTPAQGPFHIAFGLILMAVCLTFAATVYLVRIFQDAQLPPSVQPATPAALQQDANTTVGPELSCLALKNDCAGETAPEIAEAPASPLDAIEPRGQGCSASRTRETVAEIVPSPSRASHLPAVPVGGRVLLVGGDPKLLEMECGWLSENNAEPIVEPEWLPALARLLNDPPHLTVLNPMTSDGWTSSRIHEWLEHHRNQLQAPRVIVLSAEVTEDRVLNLQYCQVAC